MARGLLGDQSAGGVVDIHAFFDSDLPKLIAEHVSLGVLVSIGTTRDRGAVSITVTFDGDWDRSYFRDSTDACDFLRLAADVLRARGLTPEPAPAPSVPLATKRRSRLS